MATGTIDQHAADELVLWAENTYELYGQFTSICKNLNRKMHKATYDANKACKLWRYMADSAARHYTQEFYAPGTVWHQVFNTATRNEAARQLEQSNRAEIELGNWD